MWFIRLQFLAVRQHGKASRQDRRKLGYSQQAPAGLMHDIPHPHRTMHETE
jgi:hypothetical protein